VAHPISWLHHRQLAVAVFKNVIGNVLFAAFAAPLDPSKRDDLAPNPAALDNAPSSCLERRVDVFSAVSASFIRQSVCH